MIQLKSISIIGCGWLGKPLAKTLEKESRVQCFDREKTSDNSSFWQNDTIIIAINTKDNYLKTLQKIAKLSSTSSNIILLSSISVYREFNSILDENVDITQKNLQKEAEELMQNLRKNLLILRLGGLMGEDRISGKWKKVSSFKDGPVNYIHREDVINIIKKLLKSDVKNGIFNLVAPQHPLRSLVHEQNAKNFGFMLGSFKEKTSKIINSDAIIKKLNYTFLYPNPLKFWN
ncbi:hypothetical protein [Sulfurimonas sp.]|uniref:hypothetical protein n=1 Tax=Sulfurimonas sp. TaxID=2022749 RepID=UPI002AB2F583|nr:hypothetical protein [Sulfurimonas sp.]